MQILIKSGLALLALIVVVFATGCGDSGNSNSEPDTMFQPFSAESNNASKALKCQRPKVTPASYGMGALYGCIQGKAETVKWFINEVTDTGRVANVKLMWNDWFKNTGYGVHADKQEAEKALNALIQMYAPQKGQVIEQAFWGSSNKTIETDYFIMEYTYSRGPAIDERLFIVTSK